MPRTGATWPDLPDKTAAPMFTSIWVGSGLIQCAAVSTRVGDISVPPQFIRFVSGPSPLVATVTIHGAADGSGTFSPPEIANAGAEASTVIPAAANKVAPLHGKANLHIQ
jgi:hypothetical protein